jgi:uncharacterized protein (DUF736 family)
MSDNNNNPTTVISAPAPAKVVGGRRTRYKRARSAYAFYASDKDVRVTIQQAHPEWKFGEVSKALGAQWKAMDATARQPYLDQSTSEKATVTSQSGPVHKRARSAYAFYMKDTEVRSGIQTAHPEWSFGEVSKAIGEKWKSLSPEHKEPYETASSEEKVKVQSEAVNVKTKRARSAYAFYMKDTSVRDAIQKEHPDWSFGQVSKQLGEQWRSMNDSGRQPYVDQSDTEKASIQASIQTDAEGVTTKAVKPKRARSAYAFYMKDTSVRDGIQKEHPEWSFGEVSKEIGAKWKAMDTTARQPYLDQSDAEKAELLEAAPVAVTAPKRRRARSAYNFYMMDASVREAIRAAHPDWKFGEVSKQLGEQWKSMDAPTRQPYVDLAEADKAKVATEQPVVASSPVGNKPAGRKRARSAYAFYAGDASVREEIQAAHPEWKFGEVSKELGAKWKAMDGEARQQYVDQSDAEKAEFATSPPTAPAVGYTTKAPKTKRGRSAYACFAADKAVREEIQTAHPEWKFGEVSKELGAKWKAMGPDGRQKYVDQSTAEKSNAQPVAQPVPVTQTTAVTNSSTVPVTKAKAVSTKAPKATKRGRTAYNYYLMDKTVREAVQQAHPEWKFGEIVKELSANWKSMDEDAKAPYVQQATSPTATAQ